MTALSPARQAWDAPVAYRFGVAMGIEANPYSGELLRSIRVAAAQAGCEITLADTGDSVSEEAAVVRALAGDRVDGVLLVPAPGDDAVINGLVAVPVMIVPVPGVKLAGA